METPLDPQAAQALEYYQKLKRVEAPTWQDVFIKSAWADRYEQTTGRPIENNPHVKDTA